MVHTYRQEFLCSEAHCEAVQKLGEEGFMLLKSQGNVLSFNLHQATWGLVVGKNATVFVRAWHYGVLKVSG